MDTTQQFQLVDEDDDYVIVDAPGCSPGAGAGGTSGGGGAAGEDSAETDAARLAQREKQIAFGKNTEAYKNYIKLVPKHKRKLRGKDAHPQTPDITLKASKRCWAGIVRKWRRDLHAYDPTPQGQVPLPLAAGAPQQEQQQQPAQQHNEAAAQQQPSQQRWQQQPQQQHQQRSKSAWQHGGNSSASNGKQAGSGSGAWGRGGGEGQPRSGPQKVTPSKRHHGGSSDSTAEEPKGDRGAAWRRDTASKRSRPTQQQAKGRAGSTSGRVDVSPQRKAWADQVDDAFGEWND